MNPGIYGALAGALLFGASTPLAKLLIGEIAPVMLAGLLYAGSGLGLAAWWLLRRVTSASPGGTGRSGTGLGRGDYVWLAGAVASGGLAGPVLLMLGLSAVPASVASLLLNLEGVFTALIAWFVFRENFDRRILLGMVLIVSGGALLGWQPGTLALSWPALAVAGACLCWGIDNNLTRKISAGDAVLIAGIKGLVAGTANLSLSLIGGAALPQASLAAAAMLVGLAGYGVSLVFFVVALRHLGSARTGAYFSTAPFIGAALSLALPGESATALFWMAAAMMAAGVGLHLAERHEHGHTHEAQSHEHPHVHDEHHGHRHEFDWDGKEPHTHPHSHATTTHSHRHFPDIHHRHTH